MRDIRPLSDEPSERSIRKIPLLHRKHQAPPVAPPELPRRKRRRPSRAVWLLGGAVLLACAILGVLVSTVFAGATVTVYLKVATVAVPATIQAQLNAPVGVLPYETLMVTRSASQTVPAAGVTRVSRAASGLVTISNAYSSASQRLIANTRFEAADGKIYRVRDSVTVPGMAGDKPGTVTATLYAESPGPVYNRTRQSTFTIPGFKGDPRYGKFSAQSGAISGGFIGDEPSVAPNDLAAAKSALQKELDAQVRAAATTEIPAGSLAIPGTLQVTFGELTQTPGEGNTAMLTQSATASGVIVRQSDFASTIARRGVTDYNGEAVLFGPRSQIDVRASTTSSTQGVVTLNLSGTAELVWQFDENAIRQALVGKGKAEFEPTIQSFEPAVERAEASIRPFWKGAFPETADKIKVKTGSK